MKVEFYFDIIPVVVLSVNFKLRKLQLFCESRPKVLVVGNLGISITALVYVYSKFGNSTKRLSFSAFAVF